MSEFAPAVAEIQGLYGPFSFPEKIFQKIWLRGEFDRAALATTDGRRIVVRHPGKWNLLGGPDFRGARLRIGDGDEITGDVELHLRAGDWAAHAHASDPAYNEVMLHVVLFPPEPEHVTRGAGGKAIPVAALLHLLHHDLEEFAAEDAVESLAGRAAARIPQELGAMNAEALGALLAKHAAARWRQKIHFARLRAARLGWEAACHFAALEILGYRFNRAAMIRVAGRWPLKEWATGAAQPDAIFAEEENAWSLQGVRPANHPRTRLRQYAEWVRRRPDWPAALKALVRRFPPLPEPAVSTKQARQQGQFPGLRTWLETDICGDALGGTRLDNLVCDGCLPLVAVQSGDEDRSFGIWYHWYPGDLPPMLTRGLRELGVFAGPSSPACHGAAQGLLGWLVEREREF